MAAMDFAAWQELSPETASARLRTGIAGLNDEQRRAGWAWLPDAFDFATDRSGPLANVPYALKDLFPVTGAPTQAGSIRPAAKAKRDSSLVADLAAAGAVLAGKTHLHEFAYGLTGENPHFGHVRHPRFPDRTAGGSSSGSAAAVAAGIVPFAIGTDTAGSVRVPAAFCGLHGWRHVPGHPWITDAFPLAPSFDTAGWLTSTVNDLRTLHHTLIGHPPSPNREPRGAYLDAATLGIDPDPATAEVLARSAAQWVETTDEATRAGLASAMRDCGLPYSILQSSEAYAVHQDRLDRDRDRYGKAVWGRIARGRNWTADQLDQARVKAMAIKLAFTSYFLTYDFLVIPITTFPAQRDDELDEAHRDILLALNTAVSIAGLPALAVPVPIADGLSLGVQIVLPSPHSPAVDWVLDRCGSC